MIRYSKQVAQLTAIAAAAVLAAPAFAATDVSANAEFDTSYVVKNDSKRDPVAPATTPQVDKFQQGGRIEVNITGKTKVGDGYVAGKGTVILGQNGRSAGRTDAGVDDAWVEGGLGAFSVRLGRFEATALASYPADVLVVGRVGYMGDKLRGRSIGNQDSYVQTDPRDVGINGQPHFTFTGDLGGGMAIEFGLTEENTGLNQTTKSAKFGIRPVFKFAAGPISGAAGFEKSGLSGSKVGIAGTGAFDLGGGASVGLNLASEGKNASLGQTKTATGFGVFGTFGPINAAVQMGQDHFGVKGNYAYVTYSMPFFVAPAVFTIALSTGKTPVQQTFTAGVLDPLTNSSYMDTAIRARVHYDF